MAINIGRLQNLAIDDGGGFVAIGGLVDATLTVEVESTDTTTHDDAARTFLPNRTTGTIDGTILWDDADAGQDDLKGSTLPTPTEVSWRFRMETASTLDEYTAQGFVTSLAPTGPNDEAGEAAFSIQLTGAITRATQ